MSITKMICVVCPVGCQLEVEPLQSGFKVSGNKCGRGESYAKDEMTNPTRMVTTTVRIKGAGVARLPVKTEHAFPKGRIFELMHVLDQVEIDLPIKRGDVICSDLLSTGIDIVASKTLLK